MGDRANVKVVDGNSTVYLYTHWSGSDLPETVRQALIRGDDRWSDGQYLARIILCEMVKGQEDETTGFGISSVVGDGDDRIVTVNTGAGTVDVSGETRPIAEYVQEERNW